MNPSYNGVGAQVPQNNPQQVGQQPMQQPVAPQQPIISSASSGTGDVVLSGGGSEKKSRKGVVILIVLVVLAALAGGGFLLWQNGVFGGGGNGGAQVNDAQTAYDSYVNYVLWGVESDGQPDLTTIEETTPYFENLRDVTLNEYVIKADQKYNNLKQAYDAVEIENKIDTAVLKSYFEEYPKIEPLLTREIVTAYLEGGESAGKKLINEKYVTTNNTEEYLANYLDAAKNLAEMKLNLIMVANGTAGCIQNNELTLSCAGISDEQRTQLGEKIMDVTSSEYEMHDAAYSVIKGLAGGLYGE